MIQVNCCLIGFDETQDMYICICQAVSDSAIRKAVDEGVRSFRDLSEVTGCGTQCGSCVKMAREVLDKALEDAGSPKSTVQLEVVSSG
jgi:bacterioferritin-associated ferredoxin